MVKTGIQALSMFTTSWMEVVAGKRGEFKTGLNWPSIVSYSHPHRRMIVIRPSSYRGCRVSDLALRKLSTSYHLIGLFYLALVLEFGGKMSTVRRFRRDTLTGEWVSACLSQLSIDN